MEILLVRNPQPLVVERSCLHFLAIKQNYIDKTLWNNKIQNLIQFFKFTFIILLNLFFLASFAASWLGLTFYFFFLKLS